MKDITEDLKKIMIKIILNGMRDSIMYKYISKYTTYCQ